MFLISSDHFAALRSDELGFSKSIKADIFFEVQPKVQPFADASPSVQVCVAVACSQRLSFPDPFGESLIYSW